MKPKRCCHDKYCCEPCEWIDGFPTELIELYQNMTPSQARRAFGEPMLVEEEFPGDMR